MHAPSICPHQTGARRLCDKCRAENVGRNAKKGRCNIAVGEFWPAGSTILTGVSGLINGGIVPIMPEVGQFWICG
ncbi:hypothetical protein TMES_16920 [Thalassospira mesophila]|uniref:Uncharacterized protein n=1 Tax=Thalassospira mesophila TaxID=1293891 RepID=A0A1Y2KX03_9PROT|nr:hypothetical protein TMES_16920 [Thalassospira mesophila]